MNGMLCVPSSTLSELRPQGTGLPWSEFTVAPIRWTRLNRETERIFEHPRRAAPGDPDRRAPGAELRLNPRMLPDSPAPQAGGRGGARAERAPSPSHASRGRDRWRGGRQQLVETEAPKRRPRPRRPRQRGRGAVGSSGAGCRGGRTARWPGGNGGRSLKASRVPSIAQAVPLADKETASQRASLTCLRAHHQDGVAPGCEPGSATKTESLPPWDDTNRPGSCP